VDNARPEVNVYHFVASGFRAEAEFAEGSGSGLAATSSFSTAPRKEHRIREDLR